MTSVGGSNHEQPNSKRVQHRTSHLLLIGAFLFGAGFAAKYAYLISEKHMPPETLLILSYLDFLAVPGVFVFCIAAHLTSNLEASLIGFVLGMALAYGLPGLIIDYLRPIGRRG